MRPLERRCRPASSTTTSWRAPRRRAPQADLLGEIREAIFGAQDGLVSTLAVVSTVAGATRSVTRCSWPASPRRWRASSAWPPASTSAAKPARDLCRADRGGARGGPRAPRRGRGRGGLHARGGRPPAGGRSTGAALARSRRSTQDDGREGARARREDGGGRRCRGRSLWARLRPRHACPDTAVPVPPRDRVRSSVAATLAVLFAIGVVKSRWTHRAWWVSGLEILVLGAFAGIAGFFFGNLLPTSWARPRPPIDPVGERKGEGSTGDGEGSDHAVGLVPREVEMSMILPGLAKVSVVSTVSAPPP